MNRTATIAANLGDTDTASRHHCTNRVAVFSKIEQAAESIQHSTIHEAFTDAHVKHASATELPTKANEQLANHSTFTKALKQDR